MKRLLTLLLLIAVSFAVRAQQWSVEYPIGEESYFFVSGDMSGEYNYLLGSVTINDSLCSFAVSMNENGFYVDSMYRINNKSEFTYALGLSDGNVLATAICGSDVGDNVYEKVWFGVLTPDLEIIKENYIDIEKPYVTYGNTMYVLKNNNNEYVMITRVTEDKNNEFYSRYDYVVYKLNSNFDLIDYNYIENISYHSEITDFTMVNETNVYAVFGNGMMVTGVETMFYIDDELNFVSCEEFNNPQNHPNNMFPKRMCVGRWFDDSRFLMAAQSTHTSGYNEWYPYVAIMDTDMNILDTLNLERVDTTDYVSQYNTLAYVDANTIYLSTFWEHTVNFIPRPNDATVFLINEKLDLLGRKTMEFGTYFCILHIQPTIDDGCIISCLLYNNDGYVEKSLIYKLRREDFEIITNVFDTEDNYNCEVYPNPVFSSINIKMDNVINDNVRVVIVDVLGRKYLDKDVYIDGNTLSIDVSKIPDGTYSCNVIYKDDYIIKRKFIKKLKI